MFSLDLFIDTSSCNSCTVFLPWTFQNPNAKNERVIYIFTDILLTMFLPRMVQDLGIVKSTHKTHTLYHSLQIINSTLKYIPCQNLRINMTNLNCVYIINVGEGNDTPLQYSCLENLTDGGAWQAAVHGIAKGRRRLSYFTFTFHFHALGKEMATHFSVLAWRIPGTGSLVGCCLWGRAESDMTEATQQQQQHYKFSIFPIY